MILRACYHRGISLKSMSVLLVHNPRSYWPLVISAELGPIAVASGLDAYELLWQHTVFPYATAFMSEAETNRLAQTLIGNHAQSNAALTQAATQGNLGQRYCVECLREDEEQFGEVYWHREHNLPFVVICRKHNMPLWVIENAANLVPSRRISIRRLPENAIGKKSLGILLPDEWAQAINHLNHQLLIRRDRSTPVEWLQHYRSLASCKGLMTKGAGLASLVFSKAFWDSYGTAFLKVAGLDFRPGSSAWPALMLREKQGISFATPKHVLLQIFLNLAESPNADVAYGHPGRVPRDYAALDAEYLKKLRDAIDGAQRKNVRVELTQLLTELGIWQVYRHNRDKLPKTKALLAAFRQTDCSARQLGRRPRKYK